MKVLLVSLLLISVSGFAQAQNKALIKARLINAFQTASLPVLSSDIFAKGWMKFEKANGLAGEESRQEDWEFCTDEKFIWSLIPLSDYKYDRMVNANHPRCKQFRSETYGMMGSQRGELAHYYYSDAAHLSSNTFLPKHTATVMKAQRRSLSMLRKAGKKKILSPMEVCALVALRDISEELAEHGSGEYGVMGDSTLYDYGINTYRTRVKFLAMTVSDWWVKTNGNSNICPNFGLELKVNELEKRVTRAENNIAKALSQNAELRREFERMKRQDVTQSAAAFLTLGFFGFKILNPF